MDANADAMVSKMEYSTFSEKMFTESDTNADGSLSRPELVAMHKKHMEEYGKMNSSPKSDVDATGHNDMGLQKGAAGKDNAETH